MQMSLRELFFWVTVFAIGAASMRWVQYGFGAGLILVVGLLILARLETFLPQPFVVLAALPVLGAVVLLIVLALR